MDRQGSACSGWQLINPAPDHGNLVRWKVRPVERHTLLYFAAKVLDERTLGSPPRNNGGTIDQAAMKNRLDRFQAESAQLRWRVVAGKATRREQGLNVAIELGPRRIRFGKAK